MIKISINYFTFTYTSHFAQCQLSSGNCRGFPDILGYLIHHRSSCPVEERYFQRAPLLPPEESCSSPLFGNVFHSPTNTLVLIARTRFPSSLACFGKRNAKKGEFLRNPKSQGGWGQAGRGSGRAVPAWSCRYVVPAHNTDLLPPAQGPVAAG